MRPTWLATNDSKERVPALTPTTRGLCHRLLGIKPRFHKITAFAASVEETTDSAPTESGPSLPDEEDHHAVETNQEDD